jgi:macrolide transport system ATP-binding/permease protein
MQDLRIALRMLPKSPGFAITSILTLSLGIAAALSIFAFVDSALIRPLPYPNPSRLVGLFETTELGDPNAGYSYPNFLDMARASTSFSAIAAYTGNDGFTLSNATGTELVSGSAVSSDFFRILGVTPILGQDFDPLPPSGDLLAAPSTVILSYATWQNRFGGRTDVLGQTVRLAGGSYTVIGVLPRSFQFAPTGPADFWTTLHSYAGNDCFQSRGCLALSVIACLKDGVTVPQALSDVRAIALREAQEHPDPDRKRSANVALLSQYILGDTKPVLLALLTGAGLLLLIAYINVAGLLLVRSENRRREFAVRGVLGASRARLTQQFVVEGLLVAIVTSALGLLAATITHQLLLKLIPADMLDSIPYLNGSTWNWHLTAFAAALVLIAVLLFAATPALRLPFSNLRSGLTMGAPGTASTSWRNFGAKLVILEIATTMVLLAGAGLLGKSLYQLLRVPMGFVPDHVAALWMFAPESQYSSSDQALSLQKEILARLQNLPGVVAAASTRSLPLTDVPSTQIGLVSKPSLADTNEVGHQVISPDYFSVLQARLLQGRVFNDHDDKNAPWVALINQTLARRYFPGENPVGQQIFYHSHGSVPFSSGPSHPLQIVGVVADIKDRDLNADENAVVYSPFDQGAAPEFYLVVRTSQHAASALPSLISTIRSVDSRIVIDRPTTISEMIHGSPAANLTRSNASLAAGFALAALLLSAVGLYGVIAYSVSRRTYEIGVRMALGATPQSVYCLILTEASRLIVLGLLIGVAGSIAAGSLLRSLLFAVHSWEISILAGVAAVLLLSTLIAVFIPARRASRVDPLVALRYE